MGCISSLLPCRNPLHCLCYLLFLRLDVVGVLDGPFLIGLVVTLQLLEAQIGVVNTFDGSLELPEAVFQPRDDDGRRVCLQGL